MATSKTNSGSMRDLGGQFRNLDTSNPSSWPIVPKALLLFVITALVVTALWFLWLKKSDEELVSEQGRENTLRNDYKTKVQKAVSLEELKKQREQVQQYVSLLEKQLPSKSEIDALLSDINQAGLGRSLQFELFRPRGLDVKEYYAELPIAVKISGGYHDMGAFAGDIANLSRIVTLNNMAIAPKRGRGAGEGVLTMDVTAKTYRYLDPEEQANRKKAAKKAKR
ncbi:MAG: type 4a pilus biogenesis protein PilO [Ottowia sp.]|nr:type 4a pilus biogenesis protein PilO [Ottowia sp.]